MHSNDLTRRLGAEFLGTAFLLATIAGSGIMGETLAAGQAGAALLPHSLAIGAILFVMITLLGPVSVSRTDSPEGSEGELTLISTVSTARSLVLRPQSTTCSPAESVQE